MRKIIYLVSFMLLICSGAEARLEGSRINDKRVVQKNQFLSSGRIEAMPTMESLKVAGFTVFPYNRRGLNVSGNATINGSLVLMPGISHTSISGIVSIPSLFDGRIFYITGIVVQVMGSIVADEITVSSGHAFSLDYDLLLYRNQDILANEINYYPIDNYEVPIGGGTVSFAIDVTNQNSSQAVVVINNFSVIGYYQ